MQQAHDAINLFITVVHTFDQGPLVLDRVAGGAGIDLARLHQILRVKTRGSRQQLRPQLGPRAVQRQSQCRLDKALRQTLEHPRIAHGGKHQIFVTDVAHRAQQLNGLHHRVQVVRGLAHAHEHHFFDRPEHARQSHLGHDFGAAHLPYQAFAPGHAKHAAHRATHLARNTQAVTRQQHAFHRLAILQAHQQARRAVLPRVLLAQGGQACKRGAEYWQSLAHRRGHEAVQRPAPTVLGLGLSPQAQHALLVQGVRTPCTQMLADVLNAVHQAPTSVMRRDFIAQVAHLGTSTRFGQAIAHLAQLLKKRVDLLLLAIHLRIELVQQVFGKTGLDFQVNQAVFNRGGNVHGLYWT